MSATAITLIILGLVAVAVTVYLFFASSATRRGHGEIPPAMRPAYSDEQLERSVLERYMAWGLVFTLGFAVFFPIYWLREPVRQGGQTDTYFVQAYERGEELYIENCALCHGREGQGGAAASPYNPEELWPAPNLTNIVKRYEDSTTVTDVREFTDMTLRRGRPGTPMPTWSAEYGGPLTDQQIDYIVTWIMANQVDDVAQADNAANVSGEQLYQENCLRCHGAELEGIVGPSLVGVFERHDEETILGILRNGIYQATGAQMPPWQNGYQHQPYTDDALRRIVDYLREQQPSSLPPGADQYQTQGLGPLDKRKPADTATET